MVHDEVTSDSKLKSSWSTDYSEEDVDQDAQNRKLCRVTVDSKYRKTSNTSRVSTVQYNMGVHLVPTYDISCCSRFVWNNYDNIAWIRHKCN